MLRLAFYELHHSMINIKLISMGRPELEFGIKEGKILVYPELQEVCGL